MIFNWSGRSGRVTHTVLSTILFAGLALSQDCTYSDDGILGTETLCAHNGYRARHQASNLIYNASMAAAAKQYTTQCIFEHPSLNNQGSNLAAGFGNPYDAMDAWYLEVNDPGYDFDNPGPIDGTLHFTQMVWTSSTQIGCGASLCNGQNDVPGWYVACYYYVEGNVVLYGDEGYYFQRNVLRNTSAAIQSRFNCPAPPSACPTTSVSLPTSATSSRSTVRSGSSSIIAPGTTTARGSSITNQGGSTVSSRSSIVSDGSVTGTIAPVIPTIIPVGSQTTPLYLNTSRTTTIASTTGRASTTLVTLSGSSSSGATTTTRAATTSQAATGSGAARTSGIVAAATPIKIAFLLPGAQRKRQASLRYLAANGAITADANQALTVNIVGNQLFSGSSYFSTNPGTGSQIFTPISPAGTISSSFAVSNNILTWTDSSFIINSNGQAKFGVLASSLLAGFTTLPAGATSVQLTAVPAASATSGSGVEFNTIVTTIGGSGSTSQTVIRATQPTTISTDGIIFNINPTNTIAGQVRPTVGSLPQCSGVAPMIARVGGGAINVMAPQNYGRM